MLKTPVILFLLASLVSACGSSTPTPSVLPTATNQPVSSPTAVPLINPSSTRPESTETPTATPVQTGLAVITSENARNLDKIVVLKGHTNRVTDLAFSGDGAYLASTGYEEKIRLWDVRTWQEVYIFPNSEADLNVIAFSPDGSLLASGQSIWDVESKEVVQKLEPRLVEPGHVAFSPDGSKIVVATSRKITVRQVSSGSELLNIDFPSDLLIVFNISYSPDGKWLAAGGGQTGMTYFWSSDTGQLVFTLGHGTERDIHDIAFSPDGQLLATGGSDTSARLWNISSGEEIHRLPLIGMYSLALSPDGTLLATAGPDRAVKVWDVQAGTMLRSLQHADELMAVAFSPDGRLIAAGGYDNTIVVWGISE